LKKKIKNSLALRVFLLTFAVLLAVSGITYGFIAWTLPVTYVSRLDRSLEKSAQDLIRKLEKNTLESCDGIFQQFREKGGASAALEHPDGTVTFPGLNIVGYTLPGAATESDPSLGGDGTYDIWMPGSDTEKRYPFTFADGGGTYYLLVGGKTESVNQVTDTLLRILPWLICLIFCVSVLTAWGYSRYLVRPMLRLSRTAQKMSELDFSGRCEERRSDELGTLGKSLNSLSKKLSEALLELREANDKLKADMQREREQERRRLEFFSAVSHELKTPITVIKGQLEGMLRGVGVYKDREKYLTRSLEVAGSMENMVREILSISRMESTEFTLQKTSFDFSELVREQLARYMELIEGKELVWQADVEDRLPITANRKMLEQAVSNLLSNAVGYSPPKAALKIEVSGQGGAVFFAVENTGVHVPEEELPRLFEAFYRVEASRSRKTGGSGLGLYLTGRILTLHGAAYQIQNTKAGILFSFTLPIDNQTAMAET